MTSLNVDMFRTDFASDSEVDAIHSLISSLSFEPTVTNLVGVTKEFLLRNVQMSEADRGTYLMSCRHHVVSCRVNQTQHYMVLYYVE